MTRPSLAYAWLARAPGWLLVLVTAVRAAVGLVKGVCLLAVWLCRHPNVALFAVLLVPGYLFVEWAGRGVAAALLIALVGLFACWGWAHPETFDRLIETPLRSWWRRTFCYRRQWQPATALAGLSENLGGVERLPVLGRVRSTAYVDVVRVRMLPHQTVSAWAKASEGLAQTFGARSCRARSVPGRPHDVELWLMRGDPLAVPVPPMGTSTKVGEKSVDLSAVPVGRREDGTTLTLPLLYSHILVGGETGAGKGSVLGSLLLGVAPAIRDGRVKVWGADLKAGMELDPWAPLLDRFAYDSPQDAVEMLEQAVAGLRARAGRLRGTTRKFVPTPETPLIVVLVDELAAVIAYVPDPQLRRRAADALSLLLSQGRAPGVCVVAATQDVRKEVVGMRDLFSVRVALRAAEAEQADMLLGRGARERGALTDQIDPRLPGVGYVCEDGRPEPVRVRFSHVTDADIARTVAEFTFSTEVVT